MPMFLRGGWNRISGIGRRIREDGVWVIQCPARRTIQCLAARTVMSISCVARKGILALALPLDTAVLLVSLYYHSTVHQTSINSKC